MRSLLLLRHAEAVAGALAADDHERPLSPRGHRDAARVVAHVARRNPSLILCSSARRAIETLEPLRARLRATAAVRIERDLYLASCDQLRERLGRIEDAETAVLVVGHNPGIAELARRLAGSGDPGVTARLESRFPAASLAALDFEATGWRKLAWGAGRLAEFLGPDDLA